MPQFDRDVPPYDQSSDLNTSRSSDEELAKLHTPPHSIEAEQAVLGSVMQSVDAWDKVAEILVQEDFYNRSHRTIFSAISRLVASDSNADPVTLKNDLESRNKLEEVGGLNYLINLARNTPSSSNIGAYAKIVRERAIIRELIGAANDISDMSFNPEGRDSKELLDLAEAKVFEIAEKRTSATDGPISIGGALRKTIARIEQLADQDRDVTGVSTGFTDLDKKTSGLQPSDLIIVAARPSMGKCIVADSLMVEPFTGERISIEQKVARRNEFVTSVDDKFCLTTKKVAQFVNDGFKPVYKVTTKLGKQIETTLTHPFLSARGWCSLANLSVGHKIAVPNKLPIFGTKKTNPDRLLQLVQKVFTSHEQQAKVKRAQAERLAISEERSFEPISLAEREASTSTEHSIIPSFVFKLCKSQLIFFMQVLFAQSGKLSIIENQRGIVEAVLKLDAPNYACAEQVQHLLLRLGYVVSLSQRQQELSMYTLRFTSNREIVDFLENVGIPVEPTQQAILHHYLNQEFDSEQTFPDELKDYIHASAQNRSWQEICDEKHLSACASGITHMLNNQSYSLTQEDIGFLGFLLDDDYLMHLAQSDAYWDEIKDISFAGHKQVYDLTVPELHNFIAQDIFVHNTTFAMNLVENALLLEEKPVLVFSLEMPAEQIMMRMLASLSRVDQTNIRTARLEDTDWAKIQSSVKMLNERDNLFIDDSSGLTPMEVRTRARKLARERGGIAMIMVDYLQLMRVPALQDNRTLEIAEISRSLKALAKELSCPVIALSQLNRSLEQRADKRPMNSDLRESGAIEQDADLIMFIYRDEVYDKNSELQGVAEIIIGKQRNGPIGTTRLTFQGQFSRFDNYAGPQYED